MGSPKPTVSVAEASKNIGRLQPALSTNAVLACTKYGLDSIRIYNNSKFPVADGSTIDVTVTTKSGANHQVFMSGIPAEGKIEPPIHVLDFVSCTAKVTK